MADKFETNDEKKSISEIQKEMYSKSKKDEKLFTSLAERDGFVCTPATRYQDIWEHWDVKLVKDGKTGLVDVKGYKKSHESGYTWLELQNVKGNIGWMRGLADAIAFDVGDKFILYNRAKLLKFIERKIVNPTGFVFIQPNDLADIAYHRYRRMGRQDIVIITPFVDMEEFKMREIYK